MSDERYTVKVPTIDPEVPERCVACLEENPPERRRLVFRRSDGAVERVSAVHWPYCAPCLGGLARLDTQVRMMTWTGFIQTVLVVYAVGGALGYYDFWFGSLGILAAFFFLFLYFAKRARALWHLEWARIDDVYKGGIGAAYSFRNRTYAEAFAEANAAPDGEAKRPVD